VADRIEKHQSACKNQRKRHVFNVKDRRLTKE